MKKLLLVFLVAFLGALLGVSFTTVHAQVPNNPWQVGVSSATHTSCTVVPSNTEVCFAADGIWVSLSGAAYVPVQTGTAVAGVTSITVCNVAGASCGASQTGAITLNIPKTAVASAPSVTISGPSISSATTLAQMTSPSATATAPTVTLQ